MATPQSKLADAQLELAALVKKQSAITYQTHPKTYWQNRQAIGDEIKKVRTRISRYEAAIIKAQGPIIHQDMFGQSFLPGSKVIWGDSGNYAGFRQVFEVIECTPKQVKLKSPYTWRSNNYTHVYPENLVVVDKLITPPVANPVTP